MPIPVVLDVDTGTDDAGALLYAATAGDLEPVAALATWGNTTSANAARNTQALLALAGRKDVPVFVGESEPSGPAPFQTDASHLMGTDGLGDLGLANRVLGEGGAGFGLQLEVKGAADALIDLARRRPGELTLLATAPLSTVASALELEPGLPGLLGGLVVMGGAVAHPGNVTAVSEANIGHDPLAGALVVEAFGRPGAMPGGATPRLVPLDVTLPGALTDAELSALESSSLPGAAELHEVWAEIWPSGRVELGADGMWPAHDLLAAWCVARPEVCGWERLPLSVDCGGSAAWGATVVDRRLPRLRRWAESWGSEAELAGLHESRGISEDRWDVAMTVDSKAFRDGVRAWLRGVSPQG